MGLISRVSSRTYRKNMEKGNHQQVIAQKTPLATLESGVIPEGADKAEAARQLLGSFLNQDYYDRKKRENIIYRYALEQEDFNPDKANKPWGKNFKEHIHLQASKAFGDGSECAP